MPIGGLIAGGLGLAGSVGGALIGSKASKDASNAQVQLGQQSLTNQNALFQRGLDTIQPYVDMGKSAGSTLLKLLTPGSDMTDILSQIPGFKFAQDWGQKAVQNIGSTMGFGGNTLKAGADYATGVAQQGFGNIAQLLLGLTGSGAGAAGSVFGNATATGANMGNTFSGIGNATAAGTLGSANALAGGLTNGANSVTNALFLSKLLPAGAGGSGAAGAGGGIYTGNPATAGFGPTYFPD